MAPMSGTPGPTSVSGSIPHLASIPHGGYHDRTPSFGAGTGTPFSSAPRQKSSAGVYASIAVVMIAILAVGGVFLSRRGSATSPPEPTPVPVGGDAFSVDVRTAPESASIEVDGVAAGIGHLVRPFPRDKQVHTMRVSANGYETLLVQFDDQRPPPSLLVLRPTTGSVIAASASAGQAKPPIVGAGAPHPPPQMPPGKVGPVAPVPPKGKPDRPRTDNIDPWE